MKCPKCGAENAPESTFCVSCGASLSEQEKKKVSDTPIDVEALKAKVMPVIKNKILWIGVAAVLVLIILISAISSIASSGNGFVEMVPTVLPNTVDGETTFIYKDKVLKDKIPGNVSDLKNSIDGKYGAFVNSEKTLYAVKGTKFIKVKEDVDSNSVTLAVSGKGLLYAVKNDNAESELYHYTFGGKSVLVSENASSWIISPDGKTAVYTVEDDDQKNTYFFNGKKSEKISSSDVSLVAMSNGGKYIYAIMHDDDSKINLYNITKKGEKSKIASNVGLSGFTMNLDHTQVLFTSDGKTYISTNAKEAVKISSKSVDLVSLDYFPVEDNDITAPVKNLYNHVYTDGDGVWLIKKNVDKSVKLVSKTSNLQLDSTASYLYYMYDGKELRVIKISDGEKASDKAVTLVDDSVERYVVTSNRSLVYYILDKELHSVNGKNGKKDRRISKDDVESVLAISGKDVVYYKMDDAIYACSNGKSGTKVLSDAQFVFSYGKIVYAMTDDTIYGTAGAKKLKKITTYDK